MTNYKIIPKKNIWLSISLILFVVLGTALFAWGFKYGIDFTGGSILEVKFNAPRPETGAIESGISDLGLGGTVIQPVGEDGLILRYQDTTEEKHQQLLEKLNTLAEPVVSDEEDKPADDQVNKSLLGIEGSNLEGVEIEEVDLNEENNNNNNNNIEELRYDAVGPSVGQELKRKSIYAVFFVLIGILLYITYAFRKVSKPVASWKYGTAAIFAMFHDAIITMGVFAVLGKYYGMEINTPFVAAILTVIGYSVHDTIVVFDRIRENLPRSEEDFAGTVNTSLNQTLVRSINTSLTSLLALTAIIVFGGSSIRPFALALAVGIFLGTYSSIFVASPILVVWEKMKSRVS